MKELFSQAQMLPFRFFELIQPFPDGMALQPSKRQPESAANYPYNMSILFDYVIFIWFKVIW
jgi:hypothetical protein